MFEVKENNENYNYKLFDNQYIKNNYVDILEETDLIYQRFCYKFSSRWGRGGHNESSTEAYQWYGIQSLTVGLTHYYYILQSLEKTIRNFANHKNPLWYQCWINFHEPNQLLDWHNHTYCSYHGYFSIDPKNSRTIFENYEICNAIGQLYIGPSNRKHKVVSDHFLGKRVTLGFDVVNENDIQMLYKDFHKIDMNLGFVKID
jgi:hypothetical protein